MLLVFRQYDLRPLSPVLLLLLVASESTARTAEHASSSRIADARTQWVLHNFHVAVSVELDIELRLWRIVLHEWLHTRAACAVATVIRNGGAHHGGGS